MGEEMEWCCGEKYGEGSGEGYSGDRVVVDLQRLDGRLTVK